MIILEVPHQLPPRVWEAKDFAHLTEIAEEASRGSGRVVWEETTPLAVLLTCDLEAKDAILYAVAKTDEARLAIYSSEILLDVARIADREGWEAKICRGDYMREGRYVHNPYNQFMTQYAAVIAALADDLHACMVFQTRQEALETLEGDEAGGNVLPAHNRIASRAALRHILGEDYYGREDS